MVEVWKDIKGYEGFYKISNLGRVKSIDRYVRTHKKSIKIVKGKQIARTDNGCGYLIVGLNKQGRGNHARGEKAYPSKINRFDVLEIRARGKSGETNVSIAKDYPVGVKQIGAINRGEKWRWLK